MPAQSLTIPFEDAPAKINLTLRVRRRRPNGYHELESLVIFSSARDRLSLSEGSSLSLQLRGPTATDVGVNDDNLVLKAARALQATIPALSTGQFTLEKHLPVAAGIGGGSSDAAAALRLLARANNINIDDPRLHRAACATGADVPVCLDPRPRMMTGIGEILSAPLHLPEIPMLLVNPRVALPTADVFRELARQRNGKPADQALDSATALVMQATSPDRKPSLPALIDAVTASQNDLEQPAMTLQPVIADLLACLRALPGCRLARMSGSGATCFAIFDSGLTASAAQKLQADHPDWWVHACDGKTR